VFEDCDMDDSEEVYAYFRLTFRPSFSVTVMFQSDNVKWSSTLYFTNKSVTMKHFCTRTNSMLKYFLPI